MDLSAEYYGLYPRQYHPPHYHHYGNGGFPDHHYGGEQHAHQQSAVNPRWTPYRQQPHRSGHAYRVGREPTPSVAQPEQVGRHSAAESLRYKTKLCVNFMKVGACVYEARCLFAHGHGELRTPAMNAQQGITTPEAVQSFQRAMKLMARNSSPAEESPTSESMSSSASNCGALSSDSGLCGTP